MTQRNRYSPRPHIRKPPGQTRLLAKVFTHARLTLHHLPVLHPVLKHQSCMPAIRIRVKVVHSNSSVLEVVHVSPKDDIQSKLSHSQTGQVNLPPTTCASSPAMANHTQPPPQWRAVSMLDCPGQDWQRHINPGQQMQDIRSNPQLHSMATAKMSTLKTHDKFELVKY